MPEWTECGCDRGYYRNGMRCPDCRERPGYMRLAVELPPDPGDAQPRADETPALLVVAGLGLTIVLAVAYAITVYGR